MNPAAKYRVAGIYRVKTSTRYPNASPQLKQTNGSLQKILAREGRGIFLDNHKTPNKTFKYLRKQLAITLLCLQPEYRNTKESIDRKSKKYNN